jgi:cold shock CspA family protein/ribosome-associated translation inhibitor RaiA
MRNALTFPLQIMFRDIAASPAVEARIRRHAQKLSQFHRRITNCRVVVSAPERGHHHERLYVVRIQIAVPGRTVFINRASPLAQAHAHVYVAIRDAFAAAVRRLEDLARRQSGRVKRHSGAAQGIVTGLHDGYGFITTTDGEEIYFRADSVIGAGVRHLKEGRKVRFALGAAAVGSHPQANVVRVINRRSTAAA